MNSAKAGRWAFLGGLVLSVIIGLSVVIGLFDFSWVAWLLVVLGLVVGFLNVSGSESQSFLVASIALIITASSLSDLPLLGDLVTNILQAAVVFIAAATVVVAVKSLFETAKN